MVRVITESGRISLLALGVVAAGWTGVVMRQLFLAVREVTAPQLLGRDVVLVLLALGEVTAMLGLACLARGAPARC